MYRNIIKVIGCFYLLGFAQGIESARRDEYSWKNARIWLDDPKRYYREIQRHQEKIQHGIEFLGQKSNYEKRVKKYQKNFDRALAISGGEGIVKKPVAVAAEKLVIPEEEVKEASLPVEVIDVGEYHDQGKRQAMEDESIVNRQTGLYAVFDGHSGNDFSRFAKYTFEETLNNEGGNLGLAIGKLEQNGREQGMRGGTTAIIAQVSSPNTITVANVGDSGAILVPGSSAILVPGARPLQATTFHKTTDRVELQRIRQYANAITEEGTRLGGINMSRVLGDYASKDDLKKKHNRSALIATPDVVQWRCQDGDILVLASDGVWDVVSSVQVAHFCKEQKVAGKTAQEIAQGLVQYALAQWPAKGWSADNVTAVVVIFGQSSPPADL